MAIDVTQFGLDPSRVIKAPKREKGKSFLSKAGEFIAPQTMKTLGAWNKGEDVSGRQLFGTALEVGSFFIPAGAAGKALGYGVKAVKGAKALSTGKKILTAAKTAGRAGAIEGAVYGAGQGVAEGKDLKGIAAEAGTTALGGAVGGAILGGGITSAIMTGKGMASIGSKTIRTVTGKLPARTRQEAVDTLSNSYLSSFVEDKASVSKGLDKIMVKGRRTGGPQTSQGLVQELASEGYMPVVEGKLANMRPVIDDLADRRGKIANFVDKYLEPVQTKTPITTLRQRVQANIADTFGIDIEKATKQADLILNSVERKFGKELTGKNVNWLRKEMNKSTRAFNKEAFINDTANTIAHTTRQIIDELLPDNKIVRSANAEIGRLFRLDETARIFHQKSIDPGFWGESLGRYLGTVLGGGGIAMMGLGGGLASGGGLVIAGLLANQGARVASSIIRKARFNPKLLQMIKGTISQNAALKQKLLKQVTGQERILLKKLFQESPSIFK